MYSKMQNMRFQDSQIVCFSLLRGLSSSGELVKASKKLCRDGPDHDLRGKNRSGLISSAISHQLHFLCTVPGLGGLEIQSTATFRHFHTFPNSEGM